MCLCVSLSVYEMGLVVKAMAMEVQGFGCSQDWPLVEEGIYTAGMLHAMGKRTMKLELDSSEFETVCKALKNHAGRLLDAGTEKDRAAAARNGRSLCRRLEQIKKSICAM